MIILIKDDKILIFLFFKINLEIGNILKEKCFLNFLFFIYEYFFSFLWIFKLSYI